MPTLDTYPTASRFRCLVFGPYKSYKTSGAATFPRPNFFDFDQGLSVIKASWWQARYGISPATIMYETFAETDVNQAGIVTKHRAFDHATKYLEECMKEAGQWKDLRTGEVRPVGRGMFDTWIIDSGTTLFDVARHKAVILLGGKELAGKELSFTHAGALKTGLLHPKMQDYGAERSLAEQFVDRVLATGKNVVLLCHDKEEWNDTGSAVTARTPLLTGQSVQRISLKFDEVYYITTSKVGTEIKTTLKTRGDSVIKCGSRYGLPDGTEWSWPAITAALKPIGFDFTTVEATGVAAQSAQPAPTVATATGVRQHA